MKRLENETFEDYKARRKENNTIVKDRIIYGVRHYDSKLLGTIVAVDNYHISKKALKGIINGKI
jgi:hypothetical protein